MGHPSRWKNNTLRRVYVVLTSTVLLPVAVVYGVVVGVTGLLEELFESAIKVWKRPN